MEMSNWLVMIAGIAGILALLCIWLGLRLAQMKERAIHYRRQAEDREQLAELLAIAQKEIAVLATHKENMGQAHETMKTEFRNTANMLFEEVSKKFSSNSEKRLGEILHPLQQRITDFQKKVEDSFGAHGKEQHTLKAEITRIVNMNEQMRLQAENLTKALRGDVKAQGNWGEIMLERILEESGLIKGRDYTTQTTATGNEGARLRPDVIINLPGDQHVIVDSKVSLTAYERYCRELDESAKAVQLKEFIASMKAHITGLEKKRYQDIDGLNAPEMVFMFLPVEGAFSLALQHDPELHSYAWNRKIALVCPSTLYASLVAIASVWRVENQSRHVVEIAQQAGSLYDKFAGFVGDMQTIESRLRQTQKAYDDAINKLSTGRGNIVGRVEQLKQLGAKTTKSLPRELLLEEQET